MALDNEILVPLARFKPSLVGTSDEVWTKLLELEHGGERHTEQGWTSLAASYWADPPAPSAVIRKVDARAAKAGK